MTSDTEEYESDFTEVAEAYFISYDPAMGELQCMEVACWRWQPEWPTPDYVIYQGQEMTHREFLKHWLEDHAKPFRPKP